MVGRNLPEAHVVSFVKVQYNEPWFWMQGTHVKYRIELRDTYQAKPVLRRYSEFRALQRLLEQVAPEAACGCTHGVRLWP